MTTPASTRPPPLRRLASPVCRARALLALQHAWGGDPCGAWRHVSAGAGATSAGAQQDGSVLVVSVDAATRTLLDTELLPETSAAVHAGALCATALGGTHFAARAKRLKCALTTRVFFARRTCACAGTDVSLPVCVRCATVRLPRQQHAACARWRRLRLMVTRRRWRARAATLARSSFAAKTRHIGQL
jgi:hypothetical protein